MLNMNTGFKTLACLAASLLVAGTARAAIVYDNSSNPSDPLTRTAESGNSEFGDEVTLAGDERTLTTWAFEYYVSPGSSITGQAFLRPLVDGTPGAPIYDSGTFEFAEGYKTFTAEGLSLDVPDTLVWTVVFDGVDVGEEYGLLFYEGPEVGTSGDFYWRNDAVDGWIMLETPGFTDNFVAQFVAVPEPGTWALLGGGLALLSFLSRRRKA